MAEFEAIYGAPSSPEVGFLPYAVRGFFDNGGRRAYVARVGASGQSAVPASEFIGNRRARLELRHGLTALMDIAEFSLLVLPDLVHPRVSAAARAAILAAAIAQCVTRHDRVLFWTRRRARRTWARTIRPSPRSTAAMPPSVAPGCK